MKRRLSAFIAVVLALLSLALGTVALAYTVPDGTIVYVTPTGEKYHREDCSYTTTVRPLTIEEAERKGYDSCSRCDPDRLTGEYNPPGDEKKISSTTSGSTNNNSKPKNDVKQVETASTNVKKDTKPDKSNPFKGIVGNILKWLLLGFFAITMGPLYIGIAIYTIGCIVKAIIDFIKSLFN